MRKPYLILVSLLTVVAAPRLSAERQPLLPDQFGSWHKGTCAAKPAHTILLQEAGERDFVKCQFTSGGQDVWISLGEYRNPSSAYEVYTSYIGTKMQPSTVSGPSAIDGEKLVLLIGNFVLEVQPPQSPTKDELQQLGETIRKSSDQAPLPPIRKYLPEGFMDGTQRYALGPEGFRNALAFLGQDEFANLVDQAGFNLSAEAMFARYRAGNDEAVLLLIEYPTQQMAEQHLRHLEQAISPAAKQARTTIERKGSLLTLVLKPTSVAYADSLRNAVSYETAVTWNEPHQTVTDPPILTSVAKIFIGTGVFMVVAVVLGIAFGGVRVLAKIFFPGKFFDRPEQMDVLQLGLSGKRIDSRDFY